MKKHRLLTALALLAPALTQASTVTVADPQAGGIGYKYTVNMGGYDQATFSSHVGAWSWEDNSLFDANAGEPPVGWTHTSNWTALEVTARVVFTIKLERDATVPWPSGALPDRLASVASMYPSFTIWRNWDNDNVPAAFAARPDVIEAFAPFGGVPADLGDWHTYNNRGAVEWAEDLVHVAQVDNSTLETIERTYILAPGKYSIVIGSNAPATDTNRQGYKATFSTSPELRGDSYFTSRSHVPLTTAAVKGLLANDLGVVRGTDLVELVSPPAKGQLTLAPDGSFTYAPGVYFGVAGRDTFTYRVLIGGDPAKPTSAKPVTISTLPSAAGQYSGHLHLDGGAEPAGLLNFSLTGRGTWSATLLRGAVTHSLTGILLANGALVPSLPAPALSLRLATHENGVRFVEARHTSAAGVLVAEADQSPFSFFTPPPFVGAHPVVLTVETATAGAPQAAGRALLRIHANGTATLAGTLGDRTPFSSGSALIAGPAGGPLIPVFDALYRANAGRVSGQLEFGAAATSTFSGALQVLKPAQTAPAVAGFSITYDAAPMP